MATITRTPSKTWKAIVRKRGWRVTITTFRTKNNATDWACTTEDEVVRGVYINRVRFHDLRHEAISRLVEAGLSDQEVAAISGHNSMRMLRGYTHLRAEGLVAKLDRLVGEGVVW